jgi:ankyrin repeat protein
VEFLLNQNEKKKITINASNMKGENAFFQACANEKTEIVRLLLKRSENLDINNVNKAGDNAFHQACAKGQIEIAMILMKDQRINFDERNANGETGLYLAWSNHHLRIVDFIINNLEINFIKRLHLVKTTSLRHRFLDLTNLAPMWLRTYEYT